MIDLVDSMDYCNLSEFPKSRYLLLKTKTIKPIYKQNPNTNFWEELLATFETSRTSHHSTCSTIKSSYKIHSVSLNTLHNELSCTFPWDRDLKSSLPQLPFLPKQKFALLIFSATNPSAVAPRDLCRTHLPWQLLCHTIILCQAITHPYKTEENDTKALMLPDTDTSPFCNLPCLHVVKSKNSQPPTEKKTIKLLYVHTQNPKARNLLQSLQKPKSVIKKLQRSPSSVPSKSWGPLTAWLDTWIWTWIQRCLCLWTQQEGRARERQEHRERVSERVFRDIPKFFCSVSSSLDWIQWSLSPE
jgi:hypothetical protein